MPRIARGETVDRGNMKMQVFDDTEDYEYFLELLKIATKRRKKLIFKVTTVTF